MGEGAVAAVDVGSTWTKLAVYGPGGETVHAVREPTPRAGRGLYDAGRLLELLRKLIARARSEGAESVGVSLFRASPVAFKPGGKPVSPIVSWLAFEERRLAQESMPLTARILARAPVVGKAFRPQSPLPLIAWLSKRHPGARVWTLDALVADALAGRYASAASHAALTGAVSPWSLRPMRWALRAVGARGLEVPEIVHDTMIGGPLSAVVADQQAAMLGSSCAEPGCVKLSLGTGCFADKPLPGKPPRLGGGIPLVVPLPGGGLRYGVEASVPGLGVALEWAAAALGGFERLGRLRPEHCGRWRGELVLRLGGWPGRTVFLLGPSRPEGWESLACAAAVGAALQCAGAAASLGDARRYVLDGGGMRIRMVSLLLSRLLPGEVERCTGSSLAGAAVLAGARHARARCESVGRGVVAAGRLLALTRALEEDPGWAVEEAGRLVRELLEG